MAVYDPTPAPRPGDDRRRGPAAWKGQAASRRLTDEERDFAADMLKDAYGAGQLDHDEFDHRLELAMNAKVGADLVPLVQDLGVESTTGAEPASEERLWAAGTHFSGYFVLALGPFLTLLLKGNTSPYVRRQALEALNYQLNFLIATLAVPIVGVLTLGVGFVVYAFMFVGWFILPAIAGFAAAIGWNWRYPFTVRLIKDHGNQIWDRQG
ncbi:DUF1707 and DUF4870 domain-containing protein [Salinactinospora qingdaonensis]|uniref:DUF1707 domain-containing protein n=1 Tax=Salinactinospora qingdaonensis TaxID=702744 RepID=A0ABP7FG10_9ACTN